MCGERRPRAFSPVPRRDGYNNTLDFVPKSVCQPFPLDSLKRSFPAACRRGKCPCRCTVCPIMYGILRGYPHSHFYRTYRTLPYTVPPQRKRFALFRAVGNVADTIFAQQIFLLHIQRPHDPVRREVLAAVHLGKAPRKLRRRAVP